MSTEDDERTGHPKEERLANLFDFTAVCGKKSRPLIRIILTDLRSIFGKIQEDVIQKLSIGSSALIDLSVEL
ncbi:hypothetical protein GWI33_006402 [Rhynchophorus ferrugineus]|uniref:Uncharacterized protein n=1 Tax=Rhynchophorus ferrugineus TaxID=354439 RepID=A0A834IFX9_RHYFE|nr:hypothetical protein GWI33_006402 [Rhynchophorus ferrugineus]